MLARQKLRRRINHALAVASPLALADAMDAHISNRPVADLRALVARSASRMDPAERAQLDLYLNLSDADDLIGHRFSAFLRQNPRAIAALDPEAIDAILAEVGELPAIERERRTLSLRTWALIAGVLAIAVLPLVAQYAHQQGMIAGLNEPFVPAQIVPFVQPVGIRPALPAAKARVHREVNPVPDVSRVAHVTRPTLVAVAPRRIAYPHPVHRARAIAWKFDRSNNPYFNRSRWHHPYSEDPLHLGARARLSVSGYLQALVSGNLRSALAHLGLPPGSSPRALSELRIVRRSTRVAVAAAMPESDGSQRVQADIITGGREYYEVFHVAKDGPAMRIVNHYYMPVNHRAQVAAHLLEQRPR